jgi:hypothetical protein
MRRTVMTSAGGQRIAIETGDAGTEVLDSSGAVLATHGTDRHEEMVAAHSQTGWAVVENGDVRPPAAAGSPPPEEGPAGPAGEVDGGPSS